MERGTDFLQGTRGVAERAGTGRGGVTSTRPTVSSGSRGSASVVLSQGPSAGGFSVPLARFHRIKALRNVPISVVADLRHTRVSDRGIGREGAAVYPGASVLQRVFPGRTNLGTKALGRGP